MLTPLKDMNQHPISSVWQVYLVWAALWVASFGKPAPAQTAWQAPNSQKSNVVSLAPPPLATPAHVPLVTPTGSASSQAAINPTTADQATSSSFLDLPIPAAVSPAAGSPTGMGTSPLTSGPTNLPAAPPNSPAGGLPLPPLPLPNQQSFPSGSMPTNTAMPTMQFPLPLHGQTTGPQSAAQGTLVNYGKSPVESREFHAGELIAVVGTEHILAGDMAVFVEPVIEKNRDRISSTEEENKIRNQLTRQALPQYVEIKALYQEFFRDMVGTAPPKDLDEMKKKVTSKAGRLFFEKQVPTMMERYEVTSLRDLEQKLSEKSLSLMTARNQFIEQVLSSELERKFVPNKFEVSRDELLAAYRDPEQESKWNVPARAKWRQLTIRFDKHENREVVDQLIRNLGNQVYLGGKPFEAVAKQSSEGFTAEDGGIYDWTTQGSLKSKPLDAAIFNLPLNRLSQVISDDIGLHIIEVLEREDGHVMDFTEAQVELRESLSEEKRIKETIAFRKKVMDRTSVWTIWPEDIPGSRPLSDALGAIQ